MCGINGIITNACPGAEPVLRERVLAMNRAIQHRGPDGSGCFAEDGVGLGHVRLAILDLSEDGAQPMFNENMSLVLVFNGEIYNYLELREELEAKGYVFRSRTDSEVILNAFEEWGEECVQHFNGMWAFGIWNRGQQRLFASRDRLGVKPLYFKAESDWFSFSSELKGIHAVRPLTMANRGKVHDYLAYGYRVNDGESFFAGVNELPPGHNLTVANGHWSISRFWSLPERASPKGWSQEDREGRLDELRALVKDSIRLRFRSDVPVAVLQSGGLDSSIIATVVNDCLEKGELGGDRVLALTAHFPGSEFDEVEVVKRLFAGFSRIDLETIEIDGNQLSANLHEFVREIGEPVASPTSFAHWSLMKELRKRGIKCVINGQGADEAFAGYGKFFFGYRLLDLVFSRPWSVLGEVRALRNHLGFGYCYILAQFFKAMAGRRAAAQMRSKMEKVNEVLSQEFRHEHAGRLLDLPMAMAPNNLDRYLRMHLEYYGFNQILHYEDHSAMSQGIEIRSPFVDYRLMEFAFSLPDEEKFAAGRTKKILRDAFRKVLPGFVVDNPLKIGFNTPSEAWLASDEMKPIFDELRREGLQCRTIWDATKMKGMFGEQQAGKFPLWRFLNVELWAREFGITNL